MAAACALAVLAFRFPPLCFGLPPLPLLLLLPERGRVVLLLAAAADVDCLDGEEAGCRGEGRGDWCGTVVAGVGAGAWALASSSSWPSSAARPKKEAKRLIICVGGVEREESKASVCVWWAGREWGAAKK